MAVKGKDRIRAKLHDGDTLIRILLAHPMHTGRGENTEGELIPAKFIQDIRLWRNEIEVLTVKCGTATSRNPFFAFQLQGGVVGDKIKLRWVDNTGGKGAAETTVQ
ncbi:Sulfur oxidation protein SoxZ [Methylophaga frappieri]|uniref:Sulfur oxidation protein SoxZ n=1 Tax=Methylophaga frappieri (strain ATCC BAA-2434 / DSM 25690 / JAM7) TaxID=754477 RepID=I1YI18_METFJ|nr:thiosulfate oxidation carrier complex protein SoxZ [Methylophaga frappieri]AFJ02561.1 Sulfur oxidation protein SoxZ [Methylophaga frappieri]